MIYILNKVPRTVLKKASAILLILVMLTSPGLLPVHAGIDEVWDAKVLTYTVCHGDEPVYEAMELAANDSLSAHFSFDVDFTELAGSVKTLSLQAPLIPDAPGVYPISGAFPDGSDLAVGFITVGEDLRATAEFYSGPSFVAGENGPAIPDWDAVSSQLTISFALPCIIDPAQLPALVPGEPATIGLSSGGVMVTLLLTPPEVQAAPALGNPDITTFSLSSDFGSVVDITNVILYKLQQDDTYQEVDPSTTLGEGDMLMLKYLFNISPSQFEDIRQAVKSGAGSGFVVCLLDFPDGLRVDGGAASVELSLDPDDPTKKFAELSIDEDSQSVVIIFTGPLWDVVGDVTITDAYIEVEFGLDLDYIDVHGLEEITIFDQKTYTLDITDAEPELTKTYAGYNPSYREVLWNIEFIPAKDNMDVPLTFTDTYSDTMEFHTLWVNGFGIEPDDPNLDISTPGTVIYHYNGPTEKGVPITLTLAMGLTDEQFDGTNIGQATDVENEIKLEGTDLPPEGLTDDDSYTISQTDKTMLLTKAAVGTASGNTTVTEIDGDTIHWLVKITTNGLGIENLVLHDNLPPGTALVPDSVKIEGYTSADWTLAPVVTPAGFTLTIPESPDGGYDGEYTVRYSTIITDKDKFADVTNEHINNPEFLNTVWLTYDWLPGFGSGPVELPKVTADPIIVNAKILKKTGSAYNAATQTITWTLVVNDRGINVKDGIITDTIPPGLKFLPDTFQSSIGPPKVVLGAHSDNSLTINIDGLGTQTATITFDTVLTDPAKYAFNTSTTYTNSAEFDGTIVKNLVDVAVVDSDSDNVTATSKVLDKSGKYNYSTNEITWTITVNDNGMPMTEVKLIDTIPAYQSFVTGSLNVSPTHAFSFGLSGNVLTVDLGSIDKKLTVTFRTKVDVNNDPRFRNSTSVLVGNDVVLQRKEYGSVSKHADVKVYNTILKKGGKHINTSGENMISYSVAINPNRLDLRNIDIKDTLPSGLKLDATSVRLYEAEMNAAGTDLVKKNPATPVSNVYLRNFPADQYFIVRLPEAKSYILEYNCMVQYAATRDYSNSIEFTGSYFSPTMKPVPIPVPVTWLGGGVGSFDIYIHPDKGQMTLIKQDGETKSALAGVTFRLWTNDNGSNVVYDEAKTGADGKLQFYNIPVGSEYWLEEVADSATSAYRISSALVRADTGSGYGDPMALSQYRFSPAAGNLTVSLEISNYPPPPYYPGDPSPTTPSPSVSPSVTPSGSPEQSPEPSTEESPDEGEEPSLTPFVSTPEPGSREYPPVEIGTQLVPTDDGGFIELDEDGTPLGTWYYDDEEEIWIFEPFIPLGVPQTGDTRIVPFAVVAFILSILGSVFFTLKYCFGMPRRKS